METLEAMHLSRESMNYLYRMGVKRVEDLVKLTLEDLEENLYNYEILRLRRELHECGLNLVNEYDGINLTKEQLDLRIDELVGLDASIRKILRQKLGIQTLGELVTTDYSTILKTRGIGLYKMKLLKDYLHSIGCCIRNEEKSIEEITAKLKEQGARLLEEDLLDPKIYMILYRNGIYTLDDLVNYGAKVLELPNYGPLRRAMLEDKLKELGIELKTNVVVDGLVRVTQPTEELIEEVRRENREIRERVESKQALLLEYEDLMKERAELKAREEELDRLIDDKLKMLKGNSYVKK